MLWPSGLFTTGSPNLNVRTTTVQRGDMYSTSEFKRGLKIEYEGIPYEIVEFQHHKPGKGGAMMRTKLKNMLNGRVVDITFRPADKVAKPDMENKVVQYLYKDNEGYAFMDHESYETFHVGFDVMGDKGGYLKDGMEVKMLFYNGKTLDLELPLTMAFKVVETEPQVKGDTVSNVTKAATLETGIVVQVPLFIGEGESIKVDTRSGQYLGRE